MHGHERNSIGGWLWSLNFFVKRVPPAMQITFGKVLSFGIAVGYAILAIHWGGAVYWKWCLGLLLPLAPIKIKAVAGRKP